MRRAQFVSIAPSRCLTKAGVKTCDATVGNSRKAVCDARRACNRSLREGPRRHSRGVATRGSLRTPVRCSARGMARSPGGVCIRSAPVSTEAACDPLLGAVGARRRQGLRCTLRFPSFRSGENAGEAAVDCAFYKGHLARAGGAVCAECVCLACANRLRLLGPCSVAARTRRAPGSDYASRRRGRTNTLGTHASTAPADLASSLPSPALGPAQGPFFTEPCGPLGECRGLLPSLPCSDAALAKGKCRKSCRLGVTCRCRSLAFRARFRICNISGLSFSPQSGKKL